MNSQEIRNDLNSLGLSENIDLATLVYIAVAVRKTRNKLSFLITGPAGLGKSELVKRVFSLFPEDNIVACTKMTPAALTRQGDLSERVLFIDENFRDAQFAQFIRLLMSEGRVIYTTANADHHLQGPTTLIETTADTRAIGIENKSRCFVVRINATREAKNNILEKQKASRTLEGLLFQRNTPNLMERHKSFQESLDPALEVAIPFSNNINFYATPHHATRMLERALNVISAVAYINQDKREIKEIDGMRYIEATEADFKEAKSLLVGISLEEDDNEIPFESIKLAEDLLLNRESLNSSFSRADLLSVLNKQYRTFKPIKKRLDPLIEAGFINIVKQKGLKNGYLYELDSDFVIMDSTDLARNSYVVLTLS